MSGFRLLGILFKAEWVEREDDRQQTGAGKVSCTSGFVLTSTKYQLLWRPRAPGMQETWGAAQLFQIAFFWRTYQSFPRIIFFSDLRILDKNVHFLCISPQLKYTLRHTAPYSLLVTSTNLTVLGSSGLAGSKDAFYKYLLTRSYVRIRYWQLGISWRSRPQREAVLHKQSCSSGATGRLFWHLSSNTSGSKFCSFLYQFPHLWRWKPSPAVAVLTPALGVPCIPRLCFYPFPKVCLHLAPEGFAVMELALGNMCSGSSITESYQLESIYLLRIQALLWQD